MDHLFLCCIMLTRQPEVSAALLAANARLLAVRQRNGIKPQLSPESSTPLLSSFPSHLGWGSSSLTKAIKQAEARAAKQEDSQTAVLPSLTSPSPPRPTPSSPPKANKIRIQPTLDIAARAAGYAAVCRVWHLLRFMDKQGKGWVTIAEVKQKLTQRASEWQIVGWRRLRQLLQAGEALFWQRDGQGRLFLAGIAKVAARLDICRLEGKSVFLPLTAMLSSITAYQAHVYAAWHSGRSSSPVSREFIAQKTAVSIRTQIAYEKMLGVKVTQNFAVGQRYSEQAHQEAAWRHGGTFRFTDSKGKLGKANQQYVAWQLPNSYSVALDAQTHSAQKKRVNQAKDLRTFRARGTGQGHRLYYANGRLAAEAALKQKQPCYWGNGTGESACGIWHVA